MLINVSALQNKVTYNETKLYVIKIIYVVIYRAKALNLTVAKSCFLSAVVLEGSLKSLRQQGQFNLTLRSCSCIIHAADHHGDCYCPPGEGGLNLAIKHHRIFQVQSSYVSISQLVNY